MTRHFDAGLEHPHRSGAHLHRHARADQSPGHAVLVGVDLDRGLGVDLAAQFPDLMIGRTPLQRLQAGRLDPREPVDRPLAGRAMNAHVGDVAHPGDQMSFQRLPAGKPSSRQRILLDVADPVLVLALGPRPVRRTGLRLELPVTGKRMEALVERHLPGLPVVVGHQRSGIVDQDLARDAREMREGPFQPTHPGRLAFMTERRNEVAPRTAQRRHEQMHVHDLLADQNPGGAEVDLQLPARRRLEADRRPGLGGQFTTQTDHRAFHRAQGHPDAMLRRQFLANHVGIAAMATEPLGQPNLKSIQCS